MDYPAWRQVFLDQPAEPGPWQPMPLTSSHQRVPPSAAQLAAKGVESAHVTRYRVIVEISLNHSAQPSPYNRYRFMASSHQCFTNDCQHYMHPLLDSQPDELEAATVLTTAVREAEKVKGLRLSRSTFPASSRSISSKRSQVPPAKPVA
jgi:hypothetical protein